MQTANSNRIKRLSTRFLTVYRLLGISVLTALLILVIGYAIIRLRSGADAAPFFASIVYMWLMYKLIISIYRTHNVEFDDEYLFILRKNADLLIPLKNIKNIEIVTLGGLFKVILYEKEHFGKAFFFKPSLLYPLNYKQKDKLVNLLRVKIEAAKNKKLIYQANTLMS
jgi:hypothetical protein